jgi:hypothetical protein
MFTFREFLENKLKKGTFDFGTIRSPAKLMAKGMPKPAKPAKPNFSFKGK